MLRIERLANDASVFRLSGRMDAENLAELDQFLKEEGENFPIILDLEGLTLVDRDAVRFLERCEMGCCALIHSPAYIRQWIDRERQ